MPTTLPESTAKHSAAIIGALTNTYASVNTIKRKLDIVGVSTHLSRLAQFGLVECKDGKYRKLAAKDNKVSKSPPKTVKKAVVKSKVQMVRVTEASVKAELDHAIQNGNVDLIGELLVKVFDGFIHKKSADFFQLRYMANWCRTKKLSGAYISKAYCLLVGSFLPFVLKLRNGDVDIDTVKSFKVFFTDDAGQSHMTQVDAICPARAIVEVRKSQRNGFHLTDVVRA